MGEGNYRDLMSEEEFRNYLATSINLRDFACVGKFKSVRRAIKRGNCSLYGQIYPKRPFNNRGNTSTRKGVHSRELNEIKKKIYAKIKETPIQGASQQGE